MAVDGKHYSRHRDAGSALQTLAISHPSSVISRMMRPAIDDIHPLPLWRVRPVPAAAGPLARRRAGGADPKILRPAAPADPPSPGSGLEAGDLHRGVERRDRLG